MEEGKEEGKEDFGPRAASSVSWPQIDFQRDVRLGAKIGGGGVGLVYEATFKGQACALKTLFDPKVDKALMQEFTDELLVMASLDHPNVVAFYGASLRPPHLCLAMELCDGSLFDLLHRDRAKLSTYERLQVAVDVAAAMKYLHHDHKPALVHRDLKSHNLLVHRGVVKLCDFGLCRHPNATAGTPAYMAPELLASVPRGGPAADVYAFGVVLAEVFTGDVPWGGYDADELRRAVARGDRPRLPSGLDAPPELRALAARCWHADPAARPNFVDVLAELTALLDATPQVSELASLDAGGGGFGDALDGLMGSGK